MNRQLGIIAFTLFFSMIGCSNKSTAPVAVERATDSGLDEQTSNNTNYQTASNSNSNLWDTTTKNDVPATTPSPTPSATPSPTPGANNGYLYPPQWNCLNGGSNYNYPQPTPYPAGNNGSTPPWYQTNNSPTISRACFDDSWGGFFGEDDLYNAGLNSFGAMQSCYQTVMSRAPQYCSAGYAAADVFKMSQMALVRCFRNILKQQQQLTQWAQPQQQSFQQNDQSFYLLLQLFSEGQ